MAAPGKKKLHRSAEPQVSDTHDHHTQYDGKTLKYFKEISINYSSGKIKGSPLDESMERVRKQLGYGKI